MIRRLADRLASIDLLDQAAELLQYQVDKRLEGAARAQVAARLAMVYLTARTPDNIVVNLPDVDDAFVKKFGNTPSYAGYTAYDDVYMIAEAVKRARFLALLPYTDQH